MARNFLILVTAILSLFYLTGCETFKEAFRQALEEGSSSENPNSDEYRPRYVISINSVVEYPRAGDLERQLEGINGESIWINSVPIFSSINISDARSIPRPGNPDICDLQFKTDRAGKLKWQVVLGNHRGDQVAFIVDGVYFNSFIPESLDDENSDWITVRIGIDSVTASGIVKFANKNYIHYHPNTSSWF